MSLLGALLVASSIQPNSPPSTSPDAPAGQRFALTDGQLFVPEGFRTAGDRFVLTLHLHGAAWAAERSFVRAGVPGVLVTVVLPGLSRVYAEKFHDPAVLPRIVDETRGCLQVLLGHGGLHIERLIVSSFSAGFGGVREMLADPVAFARIDALVMADSIHAGFVGPPAGRRVNSTPMAGFLRFGREAVAGRKFLILSHSAIRPAEYASTTETADYLLRELGLQRERVREVWPGELRLESRCRKCGFEVYGFTGESGPDHLKHLHSLWKLLERVVRDGS